MFDAVDHDRPALQGRCILVVEDEYFQAFDMAERLQGDGATVVGPAPSTDAALLLAMSPIDAAVLDIGLGGELVYELADFLIAVGMPIVFATGYARTNIPERFHAVPHYEKTVAADRVAQALTRMLS